MEPWPGIQACCRGLFVEDGLEGSGPRPEAQELLVDTSVRVWKACSEGVSLPCPAKNVRDFNPNPSPRRPSTSYYTP